MFQAPIFSSSGGATQTITGILCAYYVSWLQPGLVAANTHNTYAKYQSFVVRLLKISE
jgi:hypothetical protein